MENKKEVLIKNWSILNGWNYSVPEVTKNVLRGDAYGHDRFEDGTLVNTSTIVEIINCGTYKIVETRNTLYKVLPEDVDPDYEAEFNNAYERLSVNI